MTRALRIAAACCRRVAKRGAALQGPRSAVIPELANSEAVRA